MPDGDRLLAGPFTVPGHYRLVGDGGDAAELFAVTVPGSESEAATLSNEGIAERFGAAVVLALENPQAAVEEARERTTGRELRNLVLLVFLGIACIEGVLAGLWAFRR